MTYKIMKKLILFITTALIGLLVFTSCEDSVGPNVNSNDDAPILTSHQGGENFVLSEENADENLMTLTWEEPDFGFPAAITYYVEVDPDGADFDNAATLVETSSDSVTLKVSEVNTRLISAGIPADIQSDVNMRIRAHVNADVEDRISETFIFAFTPYTVVITFPKIYVPGGYQSSSGYTADWSPADAPPLTSVEDNDKYEGYVYFANGGSEYKFTAERNWDDGDWGGSAGSLSPGGSNIVIDETGYYKINVDLNQLTYATQKTSWGIIGEAAAGWDDGDDVAMEYDVENKVWTATTDLTAGEMKFRANGSWDLNYGSDANDGTLQQGSGTNISVAEAGNYTVTLDLSTVPYSYSLEAN